MGMYTARNAGRNDAPTQYVTPTEKASLMAELGRRSGQAIEALGLFLDTPGAIARGFLAGDPTSGFSFDRERRVTGEELLDAYGINPSDNPYLSTAAGFATELATDPLALATLPLSSGSKAFQAASKAGLTKYAPFVSTLKEGSDLTRTGKYTLQAIEKAGLKPTTSVLQTRPLVGQRLANMTTTLDEVVKAAPDPIEALRQVQQSLGDTPYAAVKDERLGGLFGFANPFTGDSWAYNPNLYAGKADDLLNLSGAERFADILDRAGQGIAWSYPARVASSAFDKAVGGRIDVADQITAMRRYQGQEQALARGRDEATQHAIRLSRLAIPEDVAATTGVSNFFTPEGGDSLLRLIEGKPIGNDLDLLRQVPGLDDWIVGWKTLAADKLDKAKQLGLSANELQDPFGLFFSPRSAAELDFGDIANMPNRSGEFSARIGNQIARNQVLAVPGGTQQLREISLDPRVRAWMKGASQETEESIGAYISQLVGNPLVTEEQGQGIARVFRRLGKDIPDDVPVFSTHPLIEQMGYIISEELRRNNAESAFEAIAEAAINRPASRVASGTHISVGKALSMVADSIGLQKGSPQTAAYLKQKIIDTLFAPGTAPNRLRLKNLSVPEETVRRIMRVSDFYSSPEVQQEVGGMFDKFTTLFKASVLSWPSRFARDFYSNIFSVWLENGNAAETLRGIWAGSKIIDGKYDEVMDYLRQIPRYAQGNATDQQIIERLQTDVGRTGILQGLATTDLLSASRRGDVAQFIPGSTPISVSRSLQNLVPDGTRSPAQMARDFLTVKGVNTTYETRNPIYVASNALGDTIDSMGRLGGFLSLMRMGVSPEEASRRMMGALVDYSSLTKFERNYMRRIFPWWAYSSRIGKYAVESLLKNPGGRYAQTLRAINDAQATTEETYIPTALRQRFAVRLPEGLLGEGSARTYLTDIDLPGVDILNLIKLGYQPDVMGSLLQTGKETIGEVLQQANPLARSAVELGTGYDFFSKRPIEQAETPYDKLYQAATGDKFARINPLVRAAISNAVSVVPLGSRSVSAAANLVDANIPSAPYRVVKALINNLTGIKLQNVNAEYEALDALNKIRQQQSPYAREFVISGVPAELLPRLPVEAQRLDALGKELQRDLRTLYNQRYGR